MVKQVVFQCSVPYCERSFGDSFSLAEHLKMHAGEKHHICPIRTCGRRFSTQGNLLRHKRLHGPIKPLECPVTGCICTFRSENKLSKHMKFHLGSVVHVCQWPACGKTFSTVGNLNRHAKRHHPDMDLRKAKLKTTTYDDTAMPRLKFDSMNASPTGSDELILPTATYDSMTRHMRAPASCPLNISTPNVSSSSGASSCLCESPPMASVMSSSLPFELTLDSKQFDDPLVSILNETIKVQDLEPSDVVPSESYLMADPLPSILDDVIQFHIDHL